VIYGKVGRLGHGKTMRAVVDARALATLRAKNRECWLASNVQIEPVPNGKFIHLPIDNFSEALGDLMMDARNNRAGLVVLIDEVDEIWGSGDWQSVRKGDKHRIKQSRHYGADMIWTAQYVDQVEKSIRNITEEVELMQAYPGPTLARFEAGKRPWFMIGQKFRPAAVRELTTEQDRDKRLGRAWYRYRREYEGLYDTTQLIEPVNAERLCSKHAREMVEAHCPVCHPDQARKPIDLRPVIDLASQALHDQAS